MHACFFFFQALYIVSTSKHITSTDKLPRSLRGGTEHRSLQQSQVKTEMAVVHGKAV